MCVHAVLHNDFYGCGGFMFFVDHKPIVGEPVQVENVRQLDGTQPVIGAKIVCGTCDGPCAPTDAAIHVGHLEYLGDFGRSPVGVA